MIIDALDRLDEDEKIAGKGEELVLGVLLGRLSEVMDGGVVEHLEEAIKRTPTPLLAHLQSVTVSGFRGVGPECELSLRPEPGLTLVVGRNGSGKSSFAEAAEYALTGSCRRWSGKSVEWKKGWRNLHSSDVSTIAVRLRIDGQKELSTVRVGWRNNSLDSGVSTITSPGCDDYTLESLGWATAVKVFRPFLSYDELTKIAEGRPIDRYNELAPMLGMDSLQTPLECLRQQRLAVEKQIKAANTQVAETVGILERHSADSSSGSMIGAALEALSGEWSLDRIEQLVIDTEIEAHDHERLLINLEQLSIPDFDQTLGIVDDLRGSSQKLQQLRRSDSEQARRLAALLQKAIEIHHDHGDSDCPVCGCTDGLHGDRIKELKAAVQQLNGEAADIEKARKDAQDALNAAKKLIGTPSRVLKLIAEVDVDSEIDIDLTEAREAWRIWHDTPLRYSNPLNELDVLSKLADHLESNCLQLMETTKKVRSDAMAARQLLANQWHMVVDRLEELLPVAREGLQAEQLIRPLKQAETWLKKCLLTMQDERFETIKKQVKEIWDTMAAGSNVTLEDVRLGLKKVMMDVTVDGYDSVALSVMSQGELNILALSLFIPRVKSSQSPFGFVMLDDPVQAMDPLRVDGLAKVLNDLAQVRQVIVLTHDDRLPESVRRLQIPATILLVTRRTGSQMNIEESLNPVQAAIADAMALQMSEGLPEEAQCRAVPNLCRHAIEAACLESGRRKLFKLGMSFAECEQLWEKSPRLLPRVAIALYGEADRGGDVYRTLHNKFGAWAVKTIKECNKFTHSGVLEGADLKDLIRRSESLAGKIAKL